MRNLESKGLLVVINLKEPNASSNLNLMYGFLYLRKYDHPIVVNHHHNMVFEIILYLPRQHKGRDSSNHHVAIKAPQRCLQTFSFLLLF